MEKKAVYGVMDMDVISHDVGSRFAEDVGGVAIVIHDRNSMAELVITPELGKVVGKAAARLLPVGHDPLPVAGYTTQSQERVDLVNSFKAMEERVLRELDALAQREDQIDKRWLALGRTHLEQAFMCVNRSIFQPQRAKLPEDE